MKNATNSVLAAKSKYNCRFTRLCSDASSRSGERFVIIVDEINRGNISRVFGELLLLLEYRNLGVELPYQKDSQLFSIPSNVFLIGTMNTTDRSLAQIDYSGKA